MYARVLGLRSEPCGCSVEAMRARACGCLAADAAAAITRIPCPGLPTPTRSYAGGQHLQRPGLRRGRQRRQAAAAHGGGRWCGGWRTYVLVMPKHTHIHTHVLTYPPCPPSSLPPRTWWSRSTPPCTPPSTDPMCRWSRSSPSPSRQQQGPRELTAGSCSSRTRRQAATAAAGCEVWTGCGTSWWTRWEGRAGDGDGGGVWRNRVASVPPGLTSAAMPT